MWSRLVRKFFVLFFVFVLGVSFCSSFVLVGGQSVESEKSYLKRFDKSSSYLRIVSFDSVGVFADGVVSFRETPSLYQFNVTFSKKPSSNVFVFDLETGGLEFVYQPPLTEELTLTDYDFVNETHAIKNGEVCVFRPVDVVGSYAVYLSNSRGGSNKVYHIYRPLFVDAEGKQVWGDLSVSKDSLTVVVDQSFLDSAAYPVVLDPTIGKTDVGGTAWVIFGANMTLCNFTISEEFETQIMSVYFYAYGGTHKCGIYNSTGVLMGETAERTWTFGKSEGWENFTFSSILTLPADDYAFAFWGNGSIKAYYDSGTADQACLKGDTAYGSFPNPIGSKDSAVAREVSMFVYSYADETAPTYSGLSHSTATTGQSSLLNATFDDDVALEGNGQYQLGWNNGTGMVWDSAVNFTSTSQTVSVAKTLPSAGTTVYYMWNFTDNVGNSNSTELQSFLVIPEASTYTPAYFADMKLQVVGNELQMPNGTVVQLVGFNKPELADDPDGIWMADTMASNSTIQEELDKMLVWGDEVNAIRLHGSIYDWMLGTTEAHSAISQKDILKYICEFAAERGMWVIYDTYRVGDFWNSNDTTINEFPYPPYTNNTDVIADEQDFVDYCADVANEMKDYGNFVFEPFNEPNSSNETELDHFIDVFQNVTNAVRYNNFTQPLIVQRGINSWTNVPPQGTSGADRIVWALTTDLVDPNDNLVVSDHNYFNHIICGNGQGGINDYYGYNTTHVDGYFTYLEHFAVAAEFPIFWGEIGINNNYIGSAYESQECERLANFINIYNQYNMSYTIYQWRAIGTYPIFFSDFTPRLGGLVYIQSINDEPFVWTSGTDVDDIYSDDVSVSESFADDMLTASFSSPVTPFTLRAFWNVSNTIYPLNSSLQCGCSNGTLVNATDYFNGTSNLIELYTTEGTSWVIGYNLDLTYYYLTIGSAVGGSCNVSVGEHAYVDGTNVIVLASASTGYSFVNWSDGVTTNPRTVAMTENVTLTPVFSAVSVSPGSSRTFDEEEEGPEPIVTDAIGYGWFDFFEEWMWPIIISGFVAAICAVVAYRAYVNNR